MGVVDLSGFTLSINSKICRLVFLVAKLLIYYLYFN